MSIKKITTWLFRDGGKALAYYSVGTISTATLLVHYLPNTFLLDKYQEVIQLYKKGFSVPVSQELQNRFEKVLDLLEVNPEKKSLYKPFHNCGFDIMSAGSSYTKFGSIIGLPINFTYDNPNTIDKSKIKIKQESIVWETEAAQTLLNSLVLSENAQMYAMAREIKYRSTPKPIIDALLSVNFILLTYGLGRNMNEKFNFYAKPRNLRLILYSIVGLFSYGMYITLTDMSQIYFEEKIDKELKKNNKIFIEGGREFYAKILERNRALRQLLGKEGEKLYSVLGNENYFFRNRHIPIVQRKSKFEEQVPA